MARKKTPAVRLNVKAEVSKRLRELRLELFGEHGGPEVARRLNLPARTWYNYETGVTVPAEVLLGFIDQTGANPVWLLTGEGPKFREDVNSRPIEDMTPQQLIRRGLEMLQQERMRSEGGEERIEPYLALDVVPLADAADPDRADVETVGRVVADSHWIPNPATTTAARLDDDAMAPVLNQGTVVAIDREVPEWSDSSRRLVAARIDGKPVVRWAQRSGKHLILGPPAERADVPVVPLDLEAEARDSVFGLVVWSWSRYEED